MKTKTSILLTVICLVLVSVGVSIEGNAQRHDSRRDQTKEAINDLPERDSIDQTYRLSAGARVEVRGINGTVDVESGTEGTAEVHIVRSARNAEDLNFRKVLIEHTGNSLVIRGEQEKDKWGHRDREVRQRVMLRLPRQVDLSVNGINGRVDVGEIDGPVRLSGINGKVEVGQAMGYSHISGINGRVNITIAQLGERGIHVSGVNGGVELRFVDEVNAVIDVTGINGSVNADVPNVVLQGKIDRNNFHATIGSGGNPIKVSGVNGHVKLVRAGSSG
jgi:hypothetical protein